MSLDRSNEFGVGFIGAGDISLYHAAGIKKAGGRLVGLYDISLERAEGRSAEFECSQYNSPEQLVSDPNIEAVYVLTPLESHFSNVKLALEANKHVLVEKPVGINIAEIEEMKSLSEERGLICMPGHNYIYDPRMVEIKRSIDEGDFGKLSSVYILYNIHHPEEVAKKYPGVIRQVMTHHAYTLLYLAGEPQEIQVLKQNQHYQEFQEEDMAMANLRMKNGALAHLEVSFATDDHSSDPWSFYIKVLGSKGSARYSYNDVIINSPGIVHSHTYSAYHRTIENEVAHFFECVRGNNEPLSSLDDAIKSQRIIEGIEQSIAKGRTVTI